ncbi:MAG: phosphatase PAP2 family protein [Candidatus Accumulibacter sp.]|jgi:acid phosphatase (class A)|nr:phosphatase PAP2 family protein [Accumulibacter sp.]
MIAKPQASGGDVVPVGLEFLPPPPLEKSAEFGRDAAFYQETRKLKGSARWAQAAFDADEKNAGKLFADSFRIALSAETTPSTLALVNFANGYANKVVRSAKDRYERTRPFAYFKEAAGSTCEPRSEAKTKTNDSYPSGHGARGWISALVLSEISPDRQGAILKRGYEIGQSRAICGAHWQSDVDIARLAAAAALAQLHNNAEFAALLERAKREIAALRSAASSTVPIVSSEGGG